MDKSLFENLTAEQKAAFKEAETPEDVLRIANEEGIDLTFEQLDALNVAGGWREDRNDWMS